MQEQTIYTGGVGGERRGREDCRGHGEVEEGIGDNEERSRCGKNLRNQIIRGVRCGRDDEGGRGFES